MKLISLLLMLCLLGCSPPYRYDTEKRERIFIECVKAVGKEASTFTVDSCGKQAERLSRF